MSTELRSDLETLPVELLHRIFDLLDCETILLSLRYVCKRMYSVSCTYDRYHLDFQSMSKHKFDRVTRLMDWRKIQSLVLSDDDKTPGQIELFLAVFPVQYWTRLKSLSLVCIEDFYLKTMLEHFQMTCVLQSLSITLDLQAAKSRPDINYLTSIIGQPTLRRLNLKTDGEVLIKFQWPDECYIEYLRISSAIDLPFYYCILRGSPNLKTLVLEDCITAENNTQRSVHSNDRFHHRLVSLTLEESCLSMAATKTFLSFTPDLVHLKLINTIADLTDAVSWEQFIRENLSKLKTFEFCFQTRTDLDVDMAYLESLAIPFQTSFWLNLNHGYITLVKPKATSRIIFYSLPVCELSLRYCTNAKKILYSTVPSTVPNSVKMAHVQELKVDVTELSTDYALEQTGETNEPLFPCVNSLSLEFCGEVTGVPIEHLSNLIDMTLVTELELDLKWLRSSVLTTFASLEGLLEKLPRLRSLSILGRHADIETRCSIVPCRVRHLQLELKYADEAKLVLNALNHLWSVLFHLPSNEAKYVIEIVEILRTNYRNFTYKVSERCLKVWLDSTSTVRTV